MTPLQVAKQECANCDSAGNCAGIWINDDLSLPEGTRCLLAEHRRCPYFEQCIIPLSRSRSREATTHEQKHAAQRLAEGVQAYEAMLDTQTAKRAKCKGCQRDVIAPKRLCEKCAKNSTLKAKRRWWAKSRKNGASESLITKDL